MTYRRLWIDRGTSPAYGGKGRVVNPRLGEALGAEETAVAASAGSRAAGIAAPGQLDRRVRFQGEANDSGLGLPDQRRRDTDRHAVLRPELAAEAQGPGRRRIVIRPAIGIAAGVDGVGGAQQRGQIGRTS